MTKLYVQFIVPLSVLIPILTGIFYYKRFSPALRIIFYYLCLAFAFNLSAVLFSRLHMNNMPLLHVYTVVEFACCILFFGHAMNSAALRKSVLLLIGVFATLSILNALFLQSVFEQNSYPRSLEAVTLIGFSLLFFYRSLAAKAEILRKIFPLLWISTGFFFYFSGSIFLFLFPEFTHAEPGVYRLAWIIHATLVLLMYVFITIAFYLSRKNHEQL